MNPQRPWAPDEEYFVLEERPETLYPPIACR